MRDIETAADVTQMVKTFYETVITDPEIGFFFTEIAKTNFDHHLPIMVAFWEFLLLGIDGFRGNPMGVHQKLHDQFPLTAAHFERWLAIWSANIDRQFSGPKAEEAKVRARSIADITKHKLHLPGSGEIYFANNSPK